MIVFQKHVINYFDDLIFTLFLEDYFSSIESTSIYVDKLLNYINKNIATHPAQKTPKQLLHLGSKYIFYKSNKRTTWFIFFEQQQHRFLITGITNNHSKNANLLNIED